MRTDNAEMVGVHKWQAAGLGTAPFHFAGFEYKTFQAHPTAPAKPGGTCAYCGAAIVNCCHVESADGKRFMVGPDCIAAVGEAGVLKAYKTSPEYRSHIREVRQAKYVAAMDAAKTLLNSGRTTLASQPHPNAYLASKGNTAADYWDWRISHASQTSIQDVAIALKSALSGA